MSKYFGNWEKKEDLASSFSTTMEELNKYKILFATYDYGSYDGSALVIMKRKSDGQLMENHGGHCSCYGLEGQWNPQEATWEQFKWIMDNGRQYEADRYTDGAIDFMKELVERNIDNGSL